MSPGIPSGVSGLTDDQLDALWGALDALEALHTSSVLCGVRVCRECSHPFPCTTVQTISRQRSIALEAPCPTEKAA